MASDPPARCDVCGGTHVPTLSEVLPLLGDGRAVVCLCEPCCADTVRRAASIIDEVALEQAEVVGARIASVAQSLRETGVVLRSIDIPRSKRSELLSCVQAN